MAEYVSVVEGRLVLVRLVQQPLIIAEALASAMGLHRNTWGNWAWRERYFGFDGLVPGRLWFRTSSSRG